MSKGPAADRRTRFFGLLYVGALDEKFTNLGRQDEALLVYLRCAANCARSFAAFDYDFSLLTNDAERLTRLGHAHAVPMPSLVELAFPRDLPAGIAFASAHRKIEVIEHFATGALGERVGLVDIDTELIAPFPHQLADGDIWALDLKSAMFDAQPGELEASLRTLTGRDLPHPRWWGGEFLVATAEGFGQIAARCSIVWPDYVARIADMGHQGDEMVVSAALNLLEGEGVSIGEAGAIGAVARYWSIRTRHLPDRFGVARRASLIHLPADKHFLAERAAEEPDPAKFAADYRRATRRRICVQSLGAVMDRLTPNRPRTYAPRL